MRTEVKTLVLVLVLEVELKLSNIPDQTTLKSCIALLRNSQADEKIHQIMGHFYFAFILCL
jgi:hypothetical protein